MDIERLKKLSGQAGTLTEMWKEVKVADNASKAATQSARKQKENNTDSTNKSATDVRTVDKKADIANDVSAELVDVDDTSLTAKAGKKDAAGQKVIKAGERLYHTVSIGDNGAPNVDDSTTLDTVDVEMWGEYGEGYVVASTKNSVYVSEVTDQILLGSADISAAVIFETVDAAKIVAKLFKHAEIRKVERLHPLFEAADDCNDDFLEENEDTDEFNLHLALSESMQDEINDRIQSGKTIQMSVNYNGKNITGYITQANNKILRVTPTLKAQKRFNLSDREIIIPVDHSAIQWSDDHPNRVVGFAKDTKGGLAGGSELSAAKTYHGGSKRGEKAKFHSGKDVAADIKKPKPGRGSKAKFKTDKTNDRPPRGKPKKGSFADPSSWGLTAGFNGPDGKTLNEFANDIRNGESNE